MPQPNELAGEQAEPMQAPADPPILPLSDSVANQIAAGEVVERPASVVKELVENSIDAGARRIAVSVQGGGLAEIQVTDDGRGIPADQLAMAFERHATSKIRTAEDLFATRSLGFRGEALPSIASVSYVTLRSKRRGARMGAEIRLEGGRRVALEAKGTPEGTTVLVTRLFFNTPARRKFLKTESGERRAITELVTRLALAHPDIQFIYEAEGCEVFRTPGDGKLISAVAALYGHALARTLIPVQREAAFGSVEGLVAPPSEAKGSRGHLSVFVNGRWVQSRSLVAAIERGYANLLPSRRYPVAIIAVTIDPTLVDVNVHPAKTEVRFRDERTVFSAVLHAVRDALLSANLISTRLPQEGDGSARADSADGERPGRAAPEQEALFPRRKAGPEPGPPPVVWRRGPEPSPVPAPAQYGGKVPAGTSARIGPYDVDLTTGEVRERPGRHPSSAPGCHVHEPVSAAGDEAALPAGPPDAEAARRCLKQARVVGQVLDTYMVVPVPWGLWLVDQHVAHERILFEQALAAAKTRPDAQPLLVPLTLDLSVQVLACLDEIGGELSAMGFEYEPFGGRSIIVRTVPAEFSGKTGAVAELFEELADLHMGGRSAERRERIAAMVACKGAVKAGQRLSTEEMESLLARLAECENPFSCPHGRPVVVEIGRSELERRFGRR